jgi:hypothetical protein
MLRDQNPEKLFQLKEIIQQVIQFISTCQKPLAKDTLLEKVMNKFAGQDKELILDEIASELEVPNLFGLDDWLENENHTKEDVIDCLQKLIQKINKIDEENSKIDNLDELLNQLRERGFVFIPPHLLRSVWQLGEAANQYLETKENGKQIEKEGIEVMISAAKWVQACRKRWRQIEKDELTSVRPIDENPF